VLNDPLRLLDSLVVSGTHHHRRREAPARDDDVLMPLGDLIE
jgi:hypothetical protein